MQCTATANATGQQCRRHAINGGTVCQVHGGAAPQVKAAARRRILELVDPALAQLATLLDSADESIRHKAIKEILDRAGITEPKQIEVITMDMVEREIARLEAELADI